MKDTLADEWGKLQNLRNNFYSEHDTFIQAHPGIDGKFTTLFNKMDEIGVVNVKQLETSKGITDEKRVIKNLLAKYTCKITSVGYLITTGQLKEDINKSENVIKRMKDEDLLNFVKMVMNKLFSMLTQMGPFGIVQQDLDNLTTTYNNFNDIEKKPHAKIKSRSHLSDRQVKLIWGAVHFIDDELDKAMNLFKTNNPGLFYDYLVQKRLPNPGVSYHEGIEIFIEEELHKTPVAGCDVEIPNQYIDQLKKSDKKGNVYFNLIIEGDYTLTVKKEGFETYTTTVTIKKNKRTVVYVLLKKI